MQRKKKVLVIDKINKRSLPKELQNKSTAEIKEYVSKQRVKRKEIQEKINELK